MRRKQAPNEFPVQTSSFRSKEEPRFQMETEVVSEKQLKIEIASVESEKFQRPPICYLCSCKSEHFRPLFDENSKMVLERIKSMFQIEPIRDEAIPDQICIPCLEKITDFIVFQQMVVDNHQKFQLQVEATKQVVTMEPYIEMKTDSERDSGGEWADMREDLESDDEYDTVLGKLLTFECAKCVETFPRFNALRRHARNNHKLNRFSVKCYQSDCRAHFGQRYKLIEHLRGHGLIPAEAEQKSEEKLTWFEKDDKDDIFLREYFTFECPECSTVLPRCRNLFKHVQTEHKLKDFTIACCQRGCNKTFSRRYTLLLHLKRHGLQSSTPARYQCDRCGVVCETRSGVYFHLKSGVCQKESCSDEVYKCALCPLEYSKKWNLKRHFEVSHNILTPDRAIKHTCPQCQKSYRREANLKYHIRIIHKREKEVICDVCAKVCADKWILKYHMDHTHTQVPKVACSVCGKLFTERNLKQHMKWHQRRPLTCDVCSKVYPNSKSLLIHKDRVHKAPKHACTECEKVFSSKGRLKEHLSTHGIGGDLYKCEWCYKTFNFSSSMSLHKKTQHLAEWLQSRNEAYSADLSKIE